MKEKVTRFARRAGYRLQVTGLILLLLLPAACCLLPHQVYAQEPSPPPETSASPQPSQLPKPSAPLPEEQAIYNLNKGLLPTEVQGKESKEPEDSNPIKVIFSAIISLFNTLFSNPSKFFAQSGSIHQAEIPPEVTTESNNPIDKLKNFLGGSSGIYGVGLPEKLQNQSIRESEKAFEKANFPEGIKPITGP